MIVSIHFGTYKIPVLDVLNVIAYHLGLGLKPLLKFNIIIKSPLWFLYIFILEGIKILIYKTNKT